MSIAPQDLSLGEVWRTVQATNDGVTQLRDEVRALPAAIAAELDAREKRAEDKIELRLKPVEADVKFLKATVWSVISFFLVSEVALVVWVVTELAAK